MDTLLQIGLFFLLYPIVVSVIAFKMNKKRYVELIQMVADLRNTVAELRARLTKVESASASAAAGEPKAPARAQPAKAPDAPATSPAAPATPGAEWRSPPIWGGSMPAFPIAGVVPATPPELPVAGAAAVTPPGVPVPVAAAAAPPAVPVAGPASAAPPAVPVTSAAAQPFADRPLTDADWGVVPPKPPAPPPAWVLAAKRWLLTGNLVAKFGLLILFIGVSFLLKYAAERVTVPIELRLAGVVLADIALLAWGWRIRLSRRGVGLPVQGAALAIMMLVTFGAYQRFHLIPSSLAFALLLMLTVFTCLLAVLQDAVWLAAFGIAGGFAAPVLTSSGQGSHIALFSYYALLNSGILAIALKKSWRLLNLLGFAFTFVIGSAWGGLKYTPDNYLSAQGFLALFFVFYVGIALAYAARQAPRLRHYVDATLVFGTPLLAFGLQYGLVRDKPYGMALSALALGLFYTSLALVLWRRRGANWRLLVDSFLAMGVVFGTLALPFALDQRWTSGAWALEGAAIVWIGLRQKRKLTWGFGLLVQCGAWVSFLMGLTGLDSQAAVNSNLWLGFLLLGGAAFAMAINFRGQQEEQGARPFEVAGNLFLAIATLWLLAGAWAEILLRIDGLDGQGGNLLVASAMVMAAILGVIASRLAWLVARAFAMIAQLAGGASLVWFVGQGIAQRGAIEHFVLGALMISIAALFSAWSIERKAPAGAGGSLCTFLLAWGGLWWFGPVLFEISDWVISHEGVVVSRAVIYQGGTAASALAFAAAAGRLAWPRLRWLSAVCWAALAYATIDLLYGLLISHWYLPQLAQWLGLAALWLAGEYLMRSWPANGWAIGPRWLKPLHVVRTAGPWMMIWPVGAALIGEWLYGPFEFDRQLLARAGWQVSGSWANYLPAWLMMVALVWLIARSRADRWPAKPIAAWYRAVLIPLGTAWSLLLAAVWNLAQNGAMAPLPYLPVLNPLDLTTGFAALLAVVCYRMLRADAAGLVSAAHAVLDRLPRIAGFAAYGWFNLMLLRSAANYLAIDYRVDALMASQFVQAMLSLTWCITALVVMRRARVSDAGDGARRRQWMMGAALLGVVVAKLFIADLANVGSMARIVSFVGVGLLMVVIGYLAPYPSQAAGTPAAAPA